MAKVIAVANQKGGCSKTSVVANLGIGLAMEGKKVAVIDADPQGSLTASLGYQEPDDIRYTLATIMMNIINEEEIDPMEGILHHEEGVDLVPANIELSGLEVSLSNVMSREMILKEYVEQIRDQYDYILIDCMPSLGVMTINALVYSHILDEDRKRNAELFEEAFYRKKNLNPQMMDAGPEKMITVPDGVDAETLMKVLGNPEMVALLSSLAKSLES